VTGQGAPLFPSPLVEEGAMIMFEKSSMIPIA